MKVVFRLFSYVKYHWKMFLAGNILLILSVVLNLTLPQVGKYIIDNIIGEHYAKGDFIRDVLIRYLGIYALVGVGSAVFKYFASLLLTKSSNRFTETLRNEVYEHIHHLPISYFDTVPAGTIVSRITHDTETIRQSFYINVFATLLISSVQIVGIYIALFMIRWEIAVALLLLVPGLWWFKSYYQKHATKNQAEIRELNGQITGSLNELSKNVSLTQSYAREEKVYEKFSKLSQRQMDISLKFTEFDFTMFSIPDAVTRLLTYAAISWVMYAHLKLSLPVTAGFVYLIMEYVSALFGPMISALDVMATVIRSVVSANRVFEVLDTPVEPEGSLTVRDTKGKMEVREVTFAYTEGKPVLKGLNFEALPGQTVAIVGPTGSGKSSLLNLLFRFYDPQAGAVLLDGQDIREFRRESLRSQMGIVLQEPFLFEGTIYSNISLNNPGISRAAAEQALQKVGGTEVFRDTENLLDLEISERGKNLSGGQRQLISFARALAYDPKILILDEATASIDTETERVIQHAMGVVKAGRTTIVIAHRLSTIRDADQIYVLRQGRVVEQGTHRELMDQGNYYAKLSAGVS